MNNTERSRKYQRAHPEENRARVKAWDMAHPDEVRARNKRYREAHPDRVREARKNWSLAHPGAYRRRDAARYARDPEKVRAEWRRKAALRYARHREAILAGTLSVAGEVVYIRSLPEPLQEVAYAIKEARRQIRAVT